MARKARVPSSVGPVIKKANVKPVRVLRTGRNCAITLVVLLLTKLASVTPIAKHDVGHWFDFVPV